MHAGTHLYLREPPVEAAGFAAARRRGPFKAYGRKAAADVRRRMSWLDGYQKPPRDLGGYIFNGLLGARSDADFKRLPLAQGEGKGCHEAGDLLQIAQVDHLHR